MSLLWYSSAHMVKVLTKGEVKMLVCPECQSEEIYVDLTGYVTLLGKVYVTGPIVRKLLVEHGVQERNFYPDGCKLIERTIPALGTQVLSSMKFECSYCGKKGNFENFKLVDCCRCGHATTEVIWCNIHGLVVCGNCIDPYGCDCCPEKDCKSNPRGSVGYKAYFSSIRRLS